MQTVTVTAKEVTACPIHSLDPDHYHHETCDCLITREPAPRVSTAVVPPSLKVSLRAINSKVAAKMLDANTHNRKLRKGRVISYAQQMQRGEWSPGGDSAIIIDRTGVILNGQHRLAAVILSETTQVFMVLTGVEPRAQDVMDRGLTRGLPDALTLRGERNVNNLAAVLRWTHRLSYIESIGGRTAHYGVEEHRPTVPQMLNLLDEHPDIRDSLKKSLPIMLHLHLRAATGAVHYRCSRIAGADCDEFFEKLHTGVDLTANDPIMVFRNQLLGEVRETRRMSDFREAAMLIKTWNYWREGVEVGLIKWNAGGAKKGRELFPMPR